MTWRLWRRQSGQARQERNEQLGRQRTHSRPRVASAAAAARSAKTAMHEGSAGLGSARAGASVMLAAAPLAAAPARGTRAVGAFAPESPAALMAAARAANRTVEEVWEEALLAWIGGGEATLTPRPSTQVVERRQRTWHEIDRTLGALRAG